MRTARIKDVNGAFYHCVSRVNHREFLLDDVNKEHFRRLMRKVEGFCDVSVLTYALMDNHFHILVEIPACEEGVSDEELFRRMGFLYNELTIMELEAEIAKWRRLGRDDMAERIKERYIVRMHDLSEFMKTLKQRFTQWYNGMRDTCGTLWQERFKSVLVENSEHALTTMAAYIDLNPVRAGLVRDPKEYRYCGYAEAVAGGRGARKGLISLARAFGEIGSWRKVSSIYRQHLYGSGERKGISAEEVARVIKENGELSLEQILRCRVKYFSDGIVLGGKEFVESVFNSNRDKFEIKRKTGACTLKYGEWEGLCAMRDPKKEPIVPPSPD
jgi:REP element-mobilizing transposase RayT